MLLLSQKNVRSHSIFTICCHKYACYTLCMWLNRAGITHPLIALISVSPYFSDAQFHNVCLHILTVTTFNMQQLHECHWHIATYHKLWSLGANHNINMCKRQPCTVYCTALQVTQVHCFWTLFTAAFTPYLHYVLNAVAEAAVCGWLNGDKSEHLQ